MILFYSRTDADYDMAYIDGKIAEFSNITNHASLHKALAILDAKNMKRLADKLGVTRTDLESTLRVLNKI